MKLDYGDDVVCLIKSMTDDEKEAIGAKPNWDIVDNGDYGKKQEYSKRLDMFIKQQALYQRNKKKIYTIFYS